MRRSSATLKCSGGCLTSSCCRSTWIRTWSAERIVSPCFHRMWSERERFRISGARPLPIFSAAVEEIRLSAPTFVQAAELLEREEDLDAAFLVGSTYSHLGMVTDARDAYGQARKLAERQGKKEASG